MSRPQSSRLTARHPCIRLAHALLLLCSTTACSDAATSLVEPPALPAEGRDALRPVTTASTMGATLQLLDREIIDFGSGSRYSGYSLVDGVRTTRVGAAAARDALAQAVALAAATPQQSPKHLSVAADAADPFRIVLPMSVVTVGGDSIAFSTVTTINKDGIADYAHAGNRQVSVLTHGAVTPIWREHSTAWLRSTDRAGVTRWPTFHATSGCHFIGTLGSSHEVVWPGGTAPGLISTRVVAASGASNELFRACYDPAPTPPPNPYCDDPDAIDCGKGGSAGSQPPYSGGATTREVGRSGSNKTVCIVTDWYENGVYIETTFDRCWTEPIYR